MAVIQLLPWPEYGKMGEEKEKQEKALALSLRQGGHFHPQCGRLRETEVDAFLRSQNGNRRLPPQKRRKTEMLQDFW